MKKNNLIDFLIILLLYIGLCAIPFERFISIDWLAGLIRILIQIGLLIFYIFYFKKTNLNIKTGKFNALNALILIPTFVVCFSNFIYMGFCKTSYSTNFSYMIFINIINCFFCVINEEIIFRLVLINNLEYKSKILRILVSSICFGGIHILNLIGNFSVQVFVQIGYTFALGILLGFAFLLTNSIYFPIVIHLFFNVFNQILFDSFIFSGNSKLYYLVNIGVGLIVAIYLFAVILIKKFKTKSLFDN